MNTITASIRSFHATERRSLLISCESQYSRTRLSISRHNYSLQAQGPSLQCSLFDTLSPQNSHTCLCSPLSIKRPYPLSLSPAVSLTPSRSLTRAINIALKRRPKKMTLPRTLRVIDEQGNNLGVMSSEIATKLAESKNLKLVEVQRSSLSSEAVYRLFTSKQQWEEAKKKKKTAKSDPINTTKDITIFSQIGEHDLAVKLSHVKEFLERGNCVRLFVLTKFRRGMSEEGEREARRAMVERVVADVAGLGEKASETAHQKRGVVCQFRPVKKKL